MRKSAVVIAGIFLLSITRIQRERIGRHYNYRKTKTHENLGKNRAHRTENGISTEKKWAQMIKYSKVRGHFKIKQRTGSAL